MSAAIALNASHNNDAVVLFQSYWDKGMPQVNSKEDYAKYVAYNTRMQQAVSLFTADVKGKTATEAKAMVMTYVCKYL